MNDHLSDIYMIERLFPGIARGKGIFFLGLVTFGFFFFLFGKYLVFGPFVFAFWMPIVFLLLFIAWWAFFLTHRYVDSKTADISVAQLVAGIIASDTRTLDSVSSFLGTEFGGKVLAHAGVVPQVVVQYLEERGRMNALVPRTLSLVAQRDVRELAFELVTRDDSFSRFLARYSVGRDELRRALDEVLSEMELARKSPRWYDPERLLRIRGIGKHWSHGVTPLLDRYERERPVVYENENELPRWKKAVRDIESLFEIDQYVKIALSGPSDFLDQAIPYIFREIDRGSVIVPLQEKRLVELDTNLMLGRAKNASELERILVGILEEVVQNGRILLFVRDWNAFENACRSIGVPPRALFGELFTSSRVSLLLANFSGTGCIPLSLD
jgi:hypothetical protein